MTRSEAQEKAQKRNHMVMRLRGAWQVMYEIEGTLPKSARLAMQEIDMILQALGAEPEAKRRANHRQWLP